MGYKFSIKEKKLQKLISVLISKDEVSQVYKDEIRRFKNNVRIPGFRKGKVSDQVVKSRFADALQKSVEKTLIQKSWQKFTEENPNEKPLGTPAVQDKALLEEQCQYSFAFSYESSPNFKIPSLDKVGLSVEDEGFKEGEVDAYLKKIQINQAQFEPSEEAIVIDDLVELSYAIALKSKKKLDLSEAAEKFLKSDSQEIYLISNPLIPEVDKKLLKHKKGDEVSWDFSFPEKFYIDDLSSREASISCKILEVKSARLSELNDEFARQHGAENIELLKKNIRDEMYSVYENQLKEKKRQVLLDHILKELKFPIPSSILKSEQERYFTHLKEKNEKEKTAKAESALKKEAEKTVSEDLTKTFVLQKLISDSKVSVNPEELDKELLHISYYYRIPIEKLKKDEKYRNLILNTYNNLLQSRALDSFVDKCQFRVNKPEQKKK